MKVPARLMEPQRILRYLLMAVLSMFILVNLNIITAAAVPLLWALALVYLLSPAVNELHHRGIPRLLAIIMVYLLIVGIVTLFFVFVVPAVVTQVNALTGQIPDQLKHWQRYLDEYEQRLRELNVPTTVLDALYSNLDRIQWGLVAFVTAVAEWIINFFSKTAAAIVVPVMAFYLLAEIEAFKSFLIRLIPSNKRSLIMQFARRVDVVLGAWLRGQVIVTTAVFILTALSLTIVGMDFALILGIISGVTNVIPYFGPVIGSIPGIILALIHGPVMLIKVVIVYVVVQQVESSVIQPQVIGRKTGLSPVIIIIALLTGGRFGGVLGLILAVPIAAILKVTLNFIADVRSGKVV